MRFLWLLAALLGVASAQGLEFGAVLPLSGPSAAVGRAAEAALAASVRDLLERGLDVQLTVLDSRSRPDEAAAGARALLYGGVHALLCCETAELARALGPLGEAAGVPTLPLAPAGGAAWTFPLLGGEAEALGRLALEPALTPLALMAPTTPGGDGAARALRPALVRSVRYPEGRAPLTPEALQAITSGARSVVIWDGASGSVTAAAGLAARGFGGVTVVRAGVWEELTALERAALSGAASVVSPAVLGYTLPDRHPSKAAASSLRRALANLPGETPDYRALTVAAGAWDAAALFGAAAEQVLTYTDLADSGAANSGDADPKVLRGTLRRALRDALVGLGPVVGAGGTYDYTDRGGAGVEAGSLVLARWQGGGFRPLP